MVVRETYKIDPNHAGLVIGKHGEGIRELKKIAGVHDICFDTNGSSHSYPLEVTGVNTSACQAVFHVVQQRIEACMTMVPEVSRTFIDVKDRSLDTIVLVPFGSEKSESVIVRGQSNTSNKMYTISSFTRSSLSDAFDVSIQDNPEVKPKFMEFTEKNISMSFQEALDNHKATANEKLRFHMSPGKIIFIGSMQGNTYQLLRSKVTGANGAEYMKKQRIKTFFTPNLHSKYIKLINKRLVDLEFENLNEGSPETYTTVHLNVGPKHTPFSVVLALDKNLETPKEATDDPRLSDAKKNAIRKILDAATFGDVMEISNRDNLKTQYHRMTLNVHPDQNLHPGATEAFKKLNDAYKKLTTGEPLNSKSLLVENNAHKDSTEDSKKLPPKVVRVKTRRIRMCVVTTLSATDLDVRGTLIGYEEDKENLSDHVREAVNLCWDQRDSSRKIPTAEGKHQIHIRSIKQVLEVNDWVKEIPYAYGGDKTALLEIKIKKLREKSGNDVNWNECVEIDLELNCESINREHLTGESLARKMIELKKWVERIFQ